MPHTGGMTQSFVYEQMFGTHDLVNDVIRCALYEWDNQLAPTTQKDENTSVYTVTNEVTGTGYTAGGVTLLNRSVIKMRGTWVLQHDDIVFPANTVSANDALIYNQTQGGKAIAWLRFDGVMSTTNAQFQIKRAPDQLPVIAFRL